MSDKTNIGIVKLIELMDFDLSRIFVDFDSVSFEEPSTDNISEYEFLEYAEMDLKDDTPQGLVNALSNAKRAIDCKVEKVIKWFGLRSRQNFPQKLETLRELGLVAPRIVNKVVKARNYLEHEFKPPEQEQVLDAVDVATLFILLIDKMLQYFPERIRIGTILSDRSQIVFDKQLIAEFNDSKKQFELKGFVYNGEIPKHFDWLEHRQNYKEIGSSILTPSDKQYKILIQLALLESSQYIEPNDHILEYLEMLSEKNA